MIFFCFKIFEKVLFKKSTPTDLINGSEWYLRKGSLSLFERIYQISFDGVLYIVYVYSFMLCAFFCFSLSH